MPRVAILLVLLLTGCTSALHRFEYRQVIMGGEAHFVLYASGESSARAAAQAAYARLAELDKVMSDYRPDSELAALNASFPVRFAASDDMLTVLLTAADISRTSDGAFDITVGPLVALWRNAIKTGRLPDANQLDLAHRRVGWRLVEIDANLIRLRGDGVQLDLGAIGKGYAADEALLMLRTHGIGSALVDLAGDIVVGDPPPGAPAWTVVVEHDEANYELSLVRQAVATSGDRYRFVEIDGTRYSHIIDPRTGYGLTGHRTATVVAERAAVADALASALVVKGASGVAMIQAYPRAACLITVVDAEGRRVLKSAGVEWPRK